MIHALSRPEELLKVTDLLHTFNLRFEDNYDVLLGIFDEGGNLIAVGARDHSILKMIAVTNDYQSTEVFSDLITALIQDGYNSGINNFFVYTKPQLYNNFTSLNFHLLSITSHVAFLEYGIGIKQYLRRHRSIVKEGKNGAVVVNCNPFTLGHRFLIEEAAKEVDHLYIFVVEEDCSSFPFNIRYNLVEKGVSDLENVSVLPTGPYAVSRVTFPCYFLKDACFAVEHQLDIDLDLFRKYLAPFFNIKIRFVGTEPYCETTSRYNSVMKEKLPYYQIEVKEIERKSFETDVISASKVRKMLQENDFSNLEKFVPFSTLEYLKSNIFGKESILATKAGRH